MAITTDLFFHGNTKKAAFFEGWYFKQIKLGMSVCIYPGYRLNRMEENSHLFK